MKTFLSYVVGLVFGLGLVVSGLTDPNKIIAFLDVTGAWYPGPLVVIGVAVAILAVVNRLVKRMPRPWVAEGWHVPTKRRIDSPLIVGSLLFGLGWGLTGFCPGPAVVGLAYGKPGIVLFVVAMFAGAALHQIMSGRTASSQRQAPSSAAPSAP